MNRMRRLSSSASPSPPRDAQRHEQRRVDQRVLRRRRGRSGRRGARCSSSSPTHVLGVTQSDVLERQQQRPADRDDAQPEDDHHRGRDEQPSARRLAEDALAQRPRRACARAAAVTAGHRQRSPGPRRVREARRRGSALAEQHRDDATARRPRTTCGYLRVGGLARARLERVEEHRQAGDVLLVGRPFGLRRGALAQRQGAGLA